MGDGTLWHGLYNPFMGLEGISRHLYLMLCKDKSKSLKTLKIYEDAVTGTTTLYIY